MVKSNREQKVEDEQKVLTELQKNCKENIDMIAKNCGFSRQKVWKIIKQLENSHKIWGYSAIVDEKQELQKFILFQKRTNTSLNSDDIKTLAMTRMDNMKKDIGITIQSTYFIHGEYDWVTIFTAKDIRQAKKFVDTIMERFPGTQTISLSQILFTLREQYIQNPDPTDMKNYIM
jgi:DNA-binding Lrp family transcriptional regulator